MITFFLLRKCAVLLKKAACKFAVKRGSAFQIPTQSKSSMRVFFPKIVKLKTMIHTLNMTFFTLTWGTTPMDKSILQILQFATKIRIHHRFFCGDNFTSKNFRELYLVELLFNIKQGYSLQPKTLLSSITYDFMRVF